ncbi:DUF5133 domain-containing protein [Streptomyces chartreusis]|uniref:DUF5133 domain-containing protein n=1 Tax=Streptomyces TaxID=1883 RepID=UPI000F736FED|nr:MULTISPECIES: DUF5133 domain-containing protein [Streptomyces]MBT1093133.1 DUF5133 domain-containing protein [Streptomyces sp. Tu102]RSO04291.1 DUF5133 domain-containing protein [Streptomyces sp. WAC 05379]
MLIPHPAILRRLVEEYEALIAHKGDVPDAGRRRELRVQDLTYTLCVSTGTREVGQALARARDMLAAAREPASAA